MTNAEFKENLEKRTKRFAVDVLNWLVLLPDTRVTGVIVFQLAKSSTAIGANYREANKAQSHSDFKHKIAIVEKESNETVFWFEVILESTLISAGLKQVGGVLHIESVALLKIFSSISRTARAKE